MYMEGEFFNPIQKQGEPMSGSTSPETKSLPKFSFIPPELIKKIEGGKPRDIRNIFALTGMIFGALSVISWIVMLFGVLYSVFGIVLSIMGLNSARKKWARIGLVLSIIGLILSLWYVFAVHEGVVNYNYFTNGFWRR